MMKMMVLWAGCHCVFYGRSTVILEEHVISLCTAYMNLSKEERSPSVGNSIGTGAVSEPIGHSRTDRKI